MLKNNRILVVEDNPEVAEIIQWNLTGAGYAVSHVADGLTALRVFDEVQPALVTIDLGLPEVSGFRLVKIFKHYAPEVPVLVVTAFSFEEAEETARAGADDFVTKPFDPADPVAKVDYHVHRQQSPRFVIPTTLVSPTSSHARAGFTSALALHLASVSPAPAG